MFFSFTPAAYKQADLLVARRIRDRLALNLTRGRGAEAVRRADEAIARALVLESRVRELTEELNARAGYRRVVGNAPCWRQALTQATQVAATETTVLLLGESGTGKEVVARFIHRGSSRADGPFVALNCAALPEKLLEAEMFGYERGAFTGATQSKPGQLEQAAGGVLFLDEVGEMSLAAQAKFLRVLEEREFQRLGGTRVLKTNARIIAATNRDLLKAIERGQFREDLYYRLNVFAIHLPPLRDRREDVLPLSEAFVTEIGRSLGRPPAGHLARGAASAARLSLAGQRPGAAQRPRARGHPVRRWPDRRRAPGSSSSIDSCRSSLSRRALPACGAATRQCAGRPQVRRTRDDRKGDEGRALQQVGSRQGAGPHTRSAVCSPAQARFRLAP